MTSTPKKGAVTPSNFSSRHGSNPTSQQGSRRGSFIFGDIPLPPSSSSDNYNFNSEIQELKWYKNFVAIESRTAIKEASLRSLREGAVFEQKEKKNTKKVYYRLTNNMLEYREIKDSRELTNISSLPCHDSFALSAIQTIQTDGDRRNTPSPSPKLRSHSRKHDSIMPQDELSFAILFLECYPAEATPPPITLKASSREQYVIWVDTLRNLTETGDSNLPETEEVVQGLSDLYALKLLYGPPPLPNYPAIPAPSLESLGVPTPVFDEKCENLEHK